MARAMLLNVAEIEVKQETCLKVQGWNVRERGLVQKQIQGCGGLNSQGKQSGSLLFFLFDVSCDL